MMPDGVKRQDARKIQATGFVPALRQSNPDTKLCAQALDRTSPDAHPTSPSITLCDPCVLSVSALRAVTTVDQP